MGWAARTTLQKADLWRFLLCSFPFIISITQSCSACIWYDTALLPFAAEILDFEMCYLQVSAAITSMFHDTCHKWQTGSQLCSQLYRRVNGHSWRDRQEERDSRKTHSARLDEKKRTRGGTGQRKGEAWQVCSESKFSSTAASQPADTPLVFIRPLCAVFFSVCTHFYSKCLSWIRASEANWQIDCDKYVAVWMVRGVSAENHTHSI